MLRILVVLVAMALTACGSGGGSPGNSRRANQAAVAPPPNRPVIGPQGPIQGPANNNINVGPEIKGAPIDDDGSSIDGPPIGTPESQSVRTLPAGPGPGPDPEDLDDTYVRRRRVDYAPLPPPPGPPIYWLDGPNGIEVYQGTPEEIEAYLNERNQAQAGQVAQAAPDASSSPRTNQRGLPEISGPKPPGTEEPQAPKQNPSAPGAQQSPDADQRVRTKNWNEKPSDWDPGLPQAPTDSKLQVRSFTHFKAADNAEYTDARIDALMESLVPSQTFIESAKQIRDVSITCQSDDQKTVTLKVEREGKEMTVTFNGQADKVNKRVTWLSGTSTSVPDLNLMGKLVCVDAKNPRPSNCQNMVLEFNPSNAPDKKYYVIYRIAPVRLTLPELDSSNKSPFLSYLQDTQFNSCLYQKTSIAKSCIYTEKSKGQLKTLLEQECPGVQLKSSGATLPLLVSWAVPNARSGFKFALSGGNNLCGSDESKSTVLQGELAIVNQSRPIVVSDQSQFKPNLKSAELKANDAGGNLNFQLAFDDSTKLQPLRFSVTSLSECTMGVQSAEQDAAGPQGKDSEKEIKQPRRPKRQSKK